jgi:hypothetical protein
MNNHHYIFIGGVHRSCTSILFTTIKKSPLVSGHHNTMAVEDEGQFLQNVYPPAYKFGGVGRFAMAKEYHFTEQHRLITQKNRIILFRQWAKHWNLSKKYLCEKTPANIIHTRFLQALFPPMSCTFLIITRHPIAVAFATNIFRKSKLPLCTLFANWIIAHETFRKDSAYLKSWLQIKAEDFTENPKAIIEKIKEILGENLAISNDLKIRNNINAKYVKMWKKIPTQQRERLIVKWNSRIIPFGYNLRDFG